MRRLSLILCILLSVAVGTIYYFRADLFSDYFERNIELMTEQDKQSAQLPSIPLAVRATEAYQYAKAHDFDLEHVILIDFGRHSGTHRFFVWSFAEQAPVIESLVAHGYGNKGFESSNQKIIFSNLPQSYASSLGKYRIGQRAWSKWGINVHYKLHGLEPTNDKAFERYIVLHSSEMIPEEEQYPAYLPLGFSQGCPVVDNETMRKVDALLQKKEKPVLLWAYAFEAE